MQTISKTKAKNMIKKSKGAFFAVDFIKRNKEKRHMICRLGVTKHLKGGVLKFKPEDYGLMVVFDTVKKTYRMINLNTLKRIKINGKTFKVA